MNSKKLTGPDKAALIVSLLGEELAPDILKLMKPSDAGRLLRSMQGISRIEAQEIDTVLKDFLALLKAPPRPMSPSDFLQKLAPKIAKGDRALEAALLKSEYRMKVFERATPELLFRVVRDEQAQTLSLILSHAPSDFAAKLIRLFPERQRIEMLLRMAKIQEVDPLLIQELDDLLMEAIDKIGGTGPQKIGGTKKVADILNAMSEEGSQLLKRLSERDQTLAADIEQDMFTFDDLLKLDVRGVQEIIKIAKRETLLLSLRGASEAMLALFTSATSSRSAQLFREDFEALGSQKKSDVVKARQEILTLTRSLIEDGRVTFDPHQDAI